jgi:hypothetical protein
MAAVMGRGVSTGIALMLPVLMLAWLGGVEATEPAPPPLHVSVGDLMKDQQQYDKRMVIVSGLVRSVEFQRGRRGSEYLLLMLEEIHGTSPEPHPSVKVVTHELTRVKVGEQILVRGVYHVEGHQGGHAYERFIDAEEIRKESAI